MSTTDYHTASLSEFAYEPEYQTCNLTYYSDVCNRHVNGLLICRVHNDSQSYKLHSSISSSDLSTYYLPDLINLLNMDEDSYKDIMKQHKKVTGDFNLIDYEELRQVFECVDELAKMTRRLQITGCSALSILNDDRKLYTAMCVEGRVTDPDRFFVPMSNFFDGKIHSVDAVAEYLITHSRQHIPQQISRTYRYGLSGSVVYLLVYRRENVFDYMVFLSEEPIANLVQALVNQAEFSDGFDFIYTVIALTNTREETCPYLLSPDGVHFKDVILYCNENRFSLPVMSLLRGLHEELKKADEEGRERPREHGFSLLPLSTSSNLPLLSSLFRDNERSSHEVNATDEHIFDILTRNWRDKDSLEDKLRDIEWSVSSVPMSSDPEDVIRHPLGTAFDVGTRFIDKHLAHLDLGLLRDFLSKWYDLTSDENIKQFEDHIDQFIRRRQGIDSEENLSRTHSLDDFLSSQSLLNEDESDIPVSFLESLMANGHGKPVY